MGRGSSGIGSGGDGFERRGAVGVADNNGRIDLSDSPLRYGKDDSLLDGSRRVAVEKFENRYAKAKIENGATFDADGNITEQRRGGKGSVKTSVAALSQADTFSHNHPREEGVLGGTFSDADLSNFTRFNVKTYRATAKEGTYSISKGKNFDAAGFRRYFNSEFAKVNSSSSTILRNLNKQVRSNSISYDNYLKAFHKESNKMLVGMHNVLIAGQKQFGYTYTLERRK